MTTKPDQAPRPTFTRRGILAVGGAAIIGAAGGYAIDDRRSNPAPAASPSAAPSPTSTPDATPATTAEVGSGATTVPFYGTHQAGIATPAALLQTFIGLDLVGRDAANAEAVLRIVTDDAARLTQGEAALGDTEPELAAHPGGLTVTVGLGRSLFARIGLEDRLPPQLEPIAAFETDRLEEQWGQTDLLLQVGSDDAVTLAHTIRMLTKDLSTLTRVRWIQPGFRSPMPATPGSSATRNLMGQVDGTINPAPASADFDTVVWIPEGPDWVAGGTVLVLRRIRMLMDTWDALDRVTKETVMGRTLDTGAPLGGTSEADPVPFDAVDDVGLPVIPQDAHIRVAHAATTEEMILRRPYSYDNGMAKGTNDIGLLFAAYMRDPAGQFVPMQRRIAQSDAFNRWNTTIGSAVYLVPPGAAEGGFIAAGLFR